MRRGRAPSRELSGSGGPQWDDPNGQLPGTGIYLISKLGGKNPKKYLG